MGRIIDSFGSDNFYVLHLPGNGKENLGFMLLDPPVISIDERITLITVATEEVRDQCPLIHQLEASGVPYVNAGMYQERGKVWEQKDKLTLILKALAEVNTPYVMLMDANDAIILRDLDAGFIERWKQFDCDFLFNASDMLYPHLFATDMEVNSPFIQHYINAGVGFGLAEYAKSIYQTAYEESTQENFCPYDSEQYYIRISWLTHDRIKIDDHSNLFLLTHGR